MRKVCRYLTTMLALAASASCVSVPEVPEAGGVTGKAVRLTVSTRADGTDGDGISLEQGDGIEDMHVWAFACDADGNVMKDDPDAYGYMYFADEDGYVQNFGSVSISLDFSNADPLERYYMFVAVVNASHFGYVYSGGEDEESTYTDINFDETTTFSELSTANFDGYSGLEGGFAMDAMIWEPTDEGDGEPYCMPCSHWKVVDLLEDGDISETESVSMEVYRAVSKVRLYMGKTSEDVQVVVDDVAVVSAETAYEGAVLSALTAEQIRGESGSGWEDASWWFDGMSIYSDYFGDALVNATDIGGGDVDIEIDGSEGDSEGDSEDTVSYGEFIPIAVGPYYSPSAITEADGILYEYIGARFLFENPDGWTDLSQFEAEEFALCPEDVDPDCCGYYLIVTYRYTYLTDISLTDEYGYPIIVDDYIEDSIPGYFDLLDSGDIIEEVKYIPLPPLRRNQSHRIKVRIQ